MRRRRRRRTSSLCSTKGSALTKNPQSFPPLSRYLSWKYLIFTNFEIFASSCKVVSFAKLQEDRWLASSPLYGHSQLVKHSKFAINQQKEPSNLEFIRVVSAVRTWIRGSQYDLTF